MGTKTAKNPKPSQSENTCVLLIHGVDKKLKAKFKAKCAEYGTPMKATIQNLMRGYIDGSIIE